MALFGSSRDISLFRHLNKELINDIISQEVDYYQLSLDDTKTNLYGEAPDGKIYFPAVRFACLIQPDPQTWSVDDQIGVNVSRVINFAFLRDILTEINVVPIVGDVINWSGVYWEIDAVIESQLFAGKNPSFGKNVGPDFGTSVSIIAEAHYTNISKLQIENSRGGI